MTNLFRVSKGGLPSGLQADMDAVLNKKFSTSTTYPPTSWPSNVNLLGPLPERTASGSIATITDGADDVPIADGVFNIDYDANGYSYMRMGKSAKNLCGGDFFRDNFLASVNSTDHPTERYISFVASAATIVGRMGSVSGSLYNRFKENTQYTFILTGERQNNSSTSFNIRIFYTDGTNYSFVFPSGFDANTKYTVLYTTPSNKTVQYLAKYNSSGTVYLYYDECGIFEGEITAQDFEAWRGEYKNIGFSLGKNLVNNDASAWVNGNIDYQNGKNSSSSTKNRTGFYRVDGGKPLVISGLSLSNASTSFRVYTYDENFAFIGYKNFWTGDYSLNTNAKFIRLTADTDLDISTLQIEYGTTATAYEPYVNIYGGYYDSVSGMLFSTKAADGSDLAEPVEYQLDPVALSTAYLDNNFWCDTGDSSITYRADIDALITELGG